MEEVVVQQGPDGALVDNILESEVSKLKRILEERVKAECDKIVYPVNTTLEKSSIPFHFDYFGRPKHGIKNLDRCRQYYTRSSFMYQSEKKHDSGFNLSEIFTHAVTEAEKYSKFKKDETAIRRFADRHSNMVAIIGQHGMRKSTLARMMLQHVLNGTMLPGTQFIFFIPFHEVDFMSETTLMNFILTGNPNWCHDKESDLALLETLKDNPNIFFVFDCLEEMPMEQFSAPIRQCDLYQPNQPHVYFSKILAGELFPRAKKLLTSRIREVLELPLDLRPFCVFDVLRLTEEAQIDLCKQICGKSFQKVFDYLQSRPDILNWCYIPTQCFTIIGIIFDHLKENGTINMRSVTDVFVRGLQSFVDADHLNDYRDKLYQVAKLAWCGFSVKKVAFSEKNFSDVNINQITLQVLLSSSFERGTRFDILTGKKNISFSHLSRQDLFVAIYLANFQPFNEFDKLIRDKKLRDPLWEAISRFLFGFCNPEVTDRLQSIFPQESVGNWSSKKELLYSFLIYSLERVESYDEELLIIFSWIREADDKTLNNMIARCLPESFKFPCYMLLSDVTDAAYVLKSVAKPLSIEFHKKSRISPNMFQYLCDQFAELPVQIKKFHLNGKRIGDVGAIAIASCLHKVDELNLSWCDITAAGVKAIAEHLKQCKMMTLNLHGNRIRDDGAVFISESLNNVGELDLSNCGISEAGFKAIASALKQCRIKLLNLSGNKMNEISVRALSKCLGNIDKLVLKGNDITAGGVEAIADQLKECKMQSLSLNENKFGDEGAKALVKCLLSLTELDLSSCKITSVGIEALSNQLNRCKIKSLKLAWNNLGDDGARSLASFWDNIDELDISYCGITPLGIEAMANEGKCGKNKSLNLRWNAIGDKGAAALAKCLNCISELDLRNCSITAVGIKAMASQILHCKIKVLKLYKNELGDGGAKAIAKCLKNIEKLDLSWNDITAVGVKAMAVELKHCKMRSLNLHGNKIGDSGAKALAKCLKNIEKLKLIFCDISVVGAKAIASELKQCKMVKLNLSHNRIRNEGALALASCYQSFDVLDLEHSCISIEHCVPIIKREYAKIKNPKPKIIGLNRQRIW